MSEKRASVYETRPPRLKLVIAGASRSGTLFMQRLLEAGKPGLVGKSAVFTHALFAGAAERLNLDLWDIEVSDLAAPLLWMLPASVPVVHQLRHPILSICSSAVNGGVRDESIVPWSKRCPRIKDCEDELSAVAAVWLEFSKAIERRAVHAFKVEDMETADQVQAILAIGGLRATAAIDGAFTSLGKSTNHWNDYELAQLAPALKRSPLWPEVAELGERYGYDMSCRS
ncbi:MAG: hypothetical protein ACE5FA_01785 [Dehalococcoidia bacterium]